MYLITGLPRSRTAWMAAYLSSLNSTCYHEPLKMMCSYRDLGGIFRKGEGVSDSGASMLLGSILKEFYVPTLIIERDIQAVHTSLIKLGIDMLSSLEAMQLNLSRYWGHPLVKKVAFDDLNNPTIMQSILNHLGIDASNYYNKLNVYRDLNVTIDMGVIERWSIVNAEGQKLIYNEMVEEVRSCLGLQL